MQFVKMHGAGNDYVYVDCIRQPAPGRPAQLARQISHRHTGVGADGLILIMPSSRADARMQMWNADGSRGEMCGNGVRCVAKYLYDSGAARRPSLRIETDRGVLELELEISGVSVKRVRVNMGNPIFANREIPTLLPGDPPIRAVLSMGESDGPPAVDRLEVTCLSMGNPHCVVFVEEPNNAWVLGLGPRVEQHRAFPNRVNVEFVQILSRREMRIRVWERGAGETQACGTGACAAVVAGVLAGVSDRVVLARLPGGDLQIEWAVTGDVFLTGAAEEVFRGEWPQAA